MHVVGGWRGEEQNGASDVGGHSPSTGRMTMAKLRTSAIVGGAASTVISNGPLESVVKLELGKFSSLWGKRL